jgi:plasmid stability protein
LKARLAIKALTIRNLPPTLAEALEREKRRRGQSLNQTVIELLDQGLGTLRTRSNGLASLGGGWSEKEFRDFEQATAQFEEVDEELWR